MLLLRIIPWCIYCPFPYFVLFCLMEILGRILGKENLISELGFWEERRDCHTMVETLGPSHSSTTGTLGVAQNLSSYPTGGRQ